MAKPLDLRGERYSMLTVIAKAPRYGDGKTRWLCKCDCGNTAVVKQEVIRRGTTKSCGCLYKSLNKRPTRVVSFRSGGQGRSFQIKCDNGREYNLARLAKLLSVPAIALSKWLKKDHTRPVGELEAPESTEQSSPYKVVIEGDLAHLSDTHNRYGERVH